MANEGFPIEVAARIAKVSTKTLRNWDDRGFLKPSVSDAPARGISRIYSFRDLIAMRVASRLRDGGIPLKSIARIVKYLRTRKGLNVTDVLASTTLITDGHDVYEIEGDVMLSTLRRPGQRVLHVLPLDELVAEIQLQARLARAA